MKRDQQRLKEEEREQRRLEEVDGDVDRAPSPASESSLEDELLAFASKQSEETAPSPPSPPPESKPQSPSIKSSAQPSAPSQPNPKRLNSKKSKSTKTRVERGDSEVPLVSKNRRRPAEVPYYERHKRKWEAYVEEIDPSEGSLTHRRRVRELDNQPTESLEMEY